MFDQPHQADPATAPRYTELLGFAQLVADTAHTFLAHPGGQATPTLVEQIVVGALLIIPGTAAAAVETLDGNGELQAPVSVGDDVTRAIMQAQNTTGEGPCLDALRDGKQVIVGDLRIDQRWPQFAARAVHAGIISMICTPLEAAGRKLGELSLMSRAADFATTEDTPTMAAVFAAHTAIAMTGARRAEDFNAALSSRDVIGQAKGILIERFKITPDIAFAMLVRTSSRTNLKIREVAEQLCLTGVLLPAPQPAASPHHLNPELQPDSRARPTRPGGRGLRSALGPN